MDDPSPPKDANEALLAGRDLQEFLDGETQQQLTIANLGSLMYYICTGNMLFYTIQSQQLVIKRQDKKIF